LGLQRLTEFGKCRERSSHIKGLIAKGLSNLYPRQRETPDRKRRSIG
jgi:hypothetical protein